MTKDAVRVLIVDDDSNLCTTLGDILVVKGYNPQIFHQGQAALAWAKERSPAVSLIDLRLDDLPGLELLKALKGASPDTECIVLTGHASQSSAIEAINAGAYSYVQKPFDMDHLLLTIRRAVEKQESVRALAQSEARYRNLVECSPQGMVIAQDHPARVVFASQPMEAISGLTPQELVGLQPEKLMGMIHPGDRERFFGNFRARLAGQDIALSDEYRLIHKDGTVRWVEIYSTLIDYEGAPATQTVFVDISERKRTEEALRNAEARMRSIFQAAPIGIGVVSKRVLVDVNDQVCELTGYSRDELIGRDARILYPSDQEYDYVGREKYRQIGKRGVGTVETYFRRKDGEVVEVLLSSAPQDLADTENNVTFTVLDVTERKKVENEILRYITHLEALHQVSQELTTELDLETLLNFIVERAVALVGGQWGSFEICRPSQDLLISTVTTGTGPDLEGTPLRRGEGLAGRVWESGQPLLANELEQEAGWAAPFEGYPLRAMVGVPVHRGTEFLGVLVVGARSAGAFDSSDIKLLEMFATQAATAIHNSHLYQEIQQHVRELHMLNRVMTASAASREIEPILATVCAELARYFGAPQAAAALLNEEKTEAVVVAEYLAEGRPSGLGEIIPVANNPSMMHLLTHKTPLAVNDAQADPLLASVHDLMRRRGTASLLLLPLVLDGEVVGSLGVDAVDPRDFSGVELDLALRVVSEASGALARARLEETRQRLSTVIEQGTESTIITDTSGTILYVNPAFERLSGYSRDEVIGQKPRLLKSGQQDDDFYRRMWQTINAGQVWRGRLVNHAKDGRPYTLDMIVTPVRNPAGQIVNFVATQRDVTRELQLEEQFHQAQKMEAVGRLAGGVAHDFNNLLTVIHLSTRLLERNLNAKDPLQIHVQRIQDAGRRAANLTRQLLAFSRREIVEPKVLDLNQLLNDLTPMLRRLVPEDIELRTQPTQDLWPIEIDPTQIEQVIINLVVNARDAMPGGGEVLIETENVVLEVAYTADRVGVEPGHYVMLSVSDTGKGMENDVKEHLFEPFFTTKERGKGTGLGLAMVHGVVKQNGGHIWVYSEPDLGTTFKIYLPRADADALHPAGADRQAAEQQVRGSETLLLVEDEVGVRELARDILSAYGYRVLTAQDGTEALQVARAYEGPIHLLVTDVVMPRLGGRALADQLESEWPAMRTLFISGYTDDAIVHHGVLEHGVHFLSKPFEMEALARKVRQVLDA